MPKKKGGANGPADWNLLCRHIQEILEKSPSGIVQSAFWTEFEKAHSYLPDPKKFAVNKRGALLDKCGSVCEVRSNRGVATVFPKSVKPKESGATPQHADRQAAETQEVVVQAEIESTEDTMHPRRHFAGSHQRRPEPYPPVHHSYGHPHPHHQQPPPLQNPTSLYDNFAALQRHQSPHESRGSGSGDRSHYHHQHHHQQSSHSQSYDRRDQHQSSHQDHSRQGRRDGPTQDQLNSVALDCIERLAESKAYVSVERIEKLVLQHFKMDSLRDLGLRHIDNIKVVNEHVRLQCKVNAYIQGFVKVRSIATVHELSQCLREYVPNKQDFSELHLGPLIKQPLVYEFFKMPHDADIPEITTENILEGLRDYLSENNLWTNQGLELEDFLKYLTDKRQLEQPYRLGVRIRSLPLAVGILKKAQRDCGQTLRTTLTFMKESVERDLTTAYKNFSATIINKEPGLCQVKREYLEKGAKEVMEDVMQKATILCQSVSYLGDMCQIEKNSRKDLRRTSEALQSFTDRMRQSKTLQILFQIAVGCSRDSINIQLTDVLELLNMRVADQEGAGRSGNKAGSAGGQDRPQPPLSEVVTKVHKYLDRCLLQGALTLAHLGRIEAKVLEDFQAQHFSDITNNTFLTFLLANEDVKKYLDECGGSSLGLSGSTASGPEGTTFHPGFHDLLDFVRQCDLHDPAQHSQIEGALCHHYRVHEPQHLGHGSVAHLFTAAEKQRHQQKEPRLLYESAVSAKTRSGLFEHQRTVGVLGHQSREAALACLQNCPLLEDLAQWSQWALVFEPEHGNLKDFVHKFGGVYTSTVTVGHEKVQMTTNILALETQPGSLLKVTCDTSPEKFATATQSRDVNKTAGHLVSMIVTNKGIGNTPLALLGNHVKTALLQMQAGVEAKTTAPGAPVQQRGPDYVVSFVLDCLVTLPLVMCQATASQVFLEPLSHVIGQAKSKELLLRQASTPQQRGRLQSLGFLLGIGEWSQSFQERSKIPEECIVRMEKVDFGDGRTVNVLDIESEEEESESEAESSDDFLSDDEVKVITPLSPEVKEILSIGPSGKSKTEDEAIEVSSQEDPTEILSDSDSSASKIIEIDGKEFEVIDDDDDDDDDDEEEEEEDSVSPGSRCHSLVEEIRREEFGVDVALSEDGRRLMEKQQARMGRALERLAHDLYSKDTHFVLELIQNADDNDYPQHMFRADSSIKPAVEFKVKENCITVLNNENGFQEKNIRAICDVGRSTKGKHKYGYIGQKGIGFKSVFRVTNCPEIHSNGYHIKFDKESSDMGYILPHWIGQEGTGCEPDNKWSTRIVLPLKAADQSQSSHSQVARFHDLHPSLLLFLHRLRSIKLTIDTAANDLELPDQGESTTRVMERVDVSEHLIEIRHTDGVDRWLVVKKQLDASSISMQAKSGVEVESTEIALAFPLQTQQQLDAKVLPDKQPVFAFLPLRSYGFRFIIQGDFDLPSNREDVDRDSMWNQWLRSEINTVFMEALQVFKSHPEFDAVQAVCRYLQFIPLEDEVLDFFRPVAISILRLLRAKPCLPTHVDSPAAGVQWRLPSQLVTSRDPLVRGLVSGPELREYLSLDYLHEGVAAALNPALTQALGVQTLGTQHLLELGRGVVDRLHAPGTDLESELAPLAKWLACIYRSLDELHPSQEVLDKLRLLPIIPLADGQLVTLEQKTVFFPLNKRTKKKGPLMYLERDVSSIHGGLVGVMEDSVADSQVWRLLELLGVKQHTPHDLVHHHILPALRDPNTPKSKPPELLIAYLVYIREQLEAHPSLLDLAELRPVALVKTSHGLHCPASHPVHFTPAYDNPIDLPRHLPGYDWVLLDACYLQNSSQTERRQWREFFNQLGVLDFLSVKDETLTLTPQEMANSVWSAYTLPSSESYIIKDYQCAQLSALITANLEPSSLPQQMGLLFAHLCQHWDTRLSRYTTTQVKNAEGQVLKEVETTFSVTLKRQPWVPAAHYSLESVGDKEQIQAIARTKLMEGSKLFHLSQPIFNLLGYHASYLNVQIPGESTLPEFLGIKTKVDVEFVKSELISWCQRSASEPDTPVTFTTSIFHIRNVYKTLRDNLIPKDLQDLFHSHPIVFFLKAPPQDGEELVTGRFYNRTEVRWKDPTFLFQKHRDSLSVLDNTNICKYTISKVYPDLEDFFLRGGRIQNTPEVKDYVNLLVHITSTNPQTRVLNDVLLILHTLGGILQEETESDLARYRVHRDLIQRKLQEHKAIPTKSGMFVSLQDHPMIGDVKGKEDIFKGTDGKYQDGVYFVEHGEKVGQARKRTKDAGGGDQEMERVLVCLQEAGVQPLSACLLEEFTTQSYRPDPKLQGYVHGVLPYIQCLLYNNYPQVYEQLLDDSIDTIMAVMQFAQVGKLEIVNSLRHLPDMVPVIQSEPCTLTNEVFYLNKDYAEGPRSQSMIHRALATFFSRGDRNCFNELKSLLVDLQGGEPDEDAYGLNPMPYTEPRWEVPPPVYTPVTPATPVTPEMEQPPLSHPGAPVSEIAESEARDSSSGGLRAWPPKSGAGGPLPGHAGSTASTQWPPPQPPEHLDRSSLPDNLRPSRLEKGAPPAADRQSSQEGDKHTKGQTAEGGMEASSEKAPQRMSSRDNQEGGQGKGGSSKEQAQVVKGEEQMEQSSSDASQTPKGRGQGQGQPPVYVAAPSSQELSQVEEYHTTSANGAIAAGQVVVKAEHIAEDTPVIIEFSEPRQDRGLDYRKRKRARVDSGHRSHDQEPHQRPFMLFGPPKWMSETSDAMYEDLGSGEALKVPDNLNLEDVTDRSEVAMWGELLVKHYLEEIMADPESPVTHVQWSSESDNPAAPYDFYVRVKDPDDEFGYKNIYIEVKTTASDSKAFCEISLQEINFAQEKKENFHLYRVFNAGDLSKVRLSRLENVAAKLLHKQIKLCLVV